MEMDLQEKTRIIDAYKDINSIIDQISKLPVFPPLVWVWVWDNVLCEIKNFDEDPEYQVNLTELEIFEKFWEDADQNGFTLEYGTEDLYEAIREWMIDADIVSEVLDEDEDDVVESEVEA
jgi:hypothetical protein